MKIELSLDLRRVQEEEVARYAPLKDSASQPYWEGERSYYHMCSQSPVQAAGWGQAQIDGHFPTGMLERSVKLNYLFESYDNEMGWNANWFRGGVSSRRVSYQLGYPV